jgi:hypothetical protein
MPFYKHHCRSTKEIQVQTGVGLQQRVSASPIISHLRRQKNLTSKMNKKINGAYQLDDFQVILHNLHLDLKPIKSNNTNLL